MSRKVGPLAEAMRCHHWVKNLFVAAAPLLAKQVTIPDRIRTVFVGSCMALGALASCGKLVPYQEASGATTVSENADSCAASLSSSKYNFDFDEWAENAPLQWRVDPPGSERYLSRTPGEAGAGSSAVQVAGDYGWITLLQEVHGLGPLPEKRIVVSARVRCWEPMTAIIILILEDFTALYSEFHPGDGEWHTLEVGCRAPAYHASDSFEIMLHHNHAPKQPCIFDNVQVFLE